LRQRADDAGNLKTTEQQKVIKTARAEAAPPSAGTPSPASQSSVAPANIYTIESVNPDEYYVPVYDPGAVYGHGPIPSTHRSIGIRRAGPAVGGSRSEQALPPGRRYGVVSTGGGIGWTSTSTGTTASTAPTS